MKIKRTKLDIVFSNLVRERANYTCQNCCENKRYDPQYMDCAHIFSRRNTSLRWHPMGAVCLCRSCHMFFGEHWYDWREFCINHFGEELLAELRLVSNQTVKWSKAVREDIYQHYKNEYSLMEGDRNGSELMIDFNQYELMHDFE